MNFSYREFPDKEGKAELLRKYLRKRETCKEHAH